MMSVQKELPKRTRKAATEPMTVSRSSRTEYEVYSANKTDSDQEGDSYRVNTVTKECTCGDWEWQQPDDGCKHYRRVAMTLGEMSVPDVHGVDGTLRKQIQRGI